jgi:hypothetical protein
MWPCVNLWACRAFAVLAAAALAASVPAGAQTTERAGLASAGPVFPGAGAPTAALPRVEAEATIDGQLDEPAWAQAARLTGFSQFRPVDSRPAEERTEILLWYSPSALHIGIVAHDRDPGSIRATVAERDKLDREDTVTVYLDTFLDRRRAFFFGVNPLGSQADGVYSEGQFNPGSLMGGSTDFNPDYIFDSKGRLTDDGYVVEVRIPFKSLRYPATNAQRWGLNVQRKVQRTGYEDTWTDTKRAASFLAQAGIIDGLHDLKRGVVKELQPFVVTSVEGERSDDDFVRDTNPDVGANLRLGLTNASIDATVNPDFSQVESDAGLVTVNERFALFYPEKRPFFLEGIELFATPNQLVYTRQIVDPFVGGKFTGKFGRLGVAYLGALDDTPGDNAWFNVARLRTDFGANSVAGVTFTDRSLTNAGNRVLAADARYVFGKLYYLLGQAGGSWTDHGTGSVAAPIWQGEFDRTGRSWGWNYKVTGIGQGFEADAGFVPRTGIVEAHAYNRFTAYGPPRAALENLTVFVGPTRIWRYEDFGGAGSIEGNDWVNTNATLRGGWALTGGVRRSFYVLDPSDYAGYEVAGPGGEPEPYEAPERLDDLWAYSAGASTPTWRRFNAKLDLLYGATPIFDEGSEGRQTVVTGSLGVRPTESLRIDLSMVFAELARERDGSEFARTLLPRLRFEYQPTRALFFRFIAEYRSERVAALEDAFTGAPLLEDGVPVGPERTNRLQLDWLASYRPSPGTIAYIGYGTLLDTTDPYARPSDMQRSQDGLFVKVAYLFRR